MNGAQALITTLVDNDVRVCFANPGTSEMHFVAALDTVPDMHGVLTLFEGVATTLNLMLAATMGVLIPTMMERFGKDPAVGSSVLITACTDSGGFFIFLGLASLFLL